MHLHNGENCENSIECPTNNLFKCREPPSKVQENGASGVTWAWWRTSIQHKLR